MIRRNILGRINYHLVWDFVLNRCEYGCEDNVINNTTVKLPLLPTNITPDKLKLYLVFS